jgi:hypothetical protein
MTSWMQSSLDLNSRALTTSSVSLGAAMRFMVVAIVAALISYSLLRDEASLLNGQPDLVDGQLMQSE